MTVLRFPFDPELTPNDPITPEMFGLVNAIVTTIKAYLREHAEMTTPELRRTLELVALCIVERSASEIDS